MAKAILTKRVTRGVGRALASLLLVLYVAGTSHLELLHSYVHSHDVAVTHSDEQEKDPCHRMIYHNDTEQGCYDDSHLIVSDKCQMCDLAFHGDQTLVSDLFFLADEFSSEPFDFYKLSIDSYWAIISSSRAPPAIA